MTVVAAVSSCSIAGEGDRPAKAERAEPQEVATDGTDGRLVSVLRDVTGRRRSQRAGSALINIM
jgi:hypothetical protein